MNNVFSVRIPPETKRKMDKLRKEINWSKEIREFIEKKIEEHEKKRTVNEVIKFISTLPEAPKGTAQKLLRENRDSH